MDLKKRIRDMNIIKGYLKKYFDCLPYESKDKAISLIQDLDNELNWFKFQKLKRDMRDNNKQISLF
jgi:hypothetical protein